MSILTEAQQQIVEDAAFQAKLPFLVNEELERAGYNPPPPPKKSGCSGGLMFGTVISLGVLTTAIALLVDQQVSVKKIVDGALQGAANSLEEGRQSAPTSKGIIYDPNLPPELSYLHGACGGPLYDPLCVTGSQLDAAGCPTDLGALVNLVVEGTTVDASLYSNDQRTGLVSGPYSGINADTVANIPSGIEIAPVNVVCFAPAE